LVFHERNHFEKIRKIVKLAFLSLKFLKFHNNVEKWATIDHEKLLKLHYFKQFKSIVLK